MTGNNEPVKKLATEDLYGKSKPDNLVYEETPEITPVVPPETESAELEHKLDLEKDLPDPLATPELSPKSGNQTYQTRSKSRFPILFFVFLFAAGLGVAYFFGTHPTLPVINLSKPGLPGVNQAKPITTPIIKNPTTTPTANDIESWISADLNGLGLTGWGIKLPPETAGLQCDGSSCPSKGTYLPGGTRFTVYSQKLTAADSDFTRTIITDAAGRAFDSNIATVSGKPAIDFSGIFVGTTTGGYSFTQMKGVLILIAPKTALGLNHFSPNGITADFAKDDIVFTQIIQSLRQH